MRFWQAEVRICPYGWLKQPHQDFSPQLLGLGRHRLRMLIFGRVVAIIETQSCFGIIHKFQVQVSRASGSGAAPNSFLESGMKCLFTS